MSLFATRSSPRVLVVPDGRSTKGAAVDPVGDTLPASSDSPSSVAALEVETPAAWERAALSSRRAALDQLHHHVTEEPDMEEEVVDETLVSSNDECLLAPDERLFSAADVEHERLEVLEQGRYRGRARP